MTDVADRLQSGPLSRGRLKRRRTEVRRWTLSRVFGVTAAITALLGLIAVVLGGIALDRLSAARSAILDDAGPALQTCQQLSVALLNQETGVRGFSLTGQEEFLSPYADGLVAEQVHVARLRELGTRTGLGMLDSNLAQVQRRAEQWRTRYAEPVIAAGRAAPGAVPAPDVVQGRVLFDEVRRALDVMLADVNAAQERDRQRIDDAAAFLRAVLVAAAGMLAGFLVVIGIGLRRAVLAPVSQLAGRVRAVVDGDLTLEIRPGGPREIAELGEDIEAMRAHILHELQVVQQVNQRLDEQTRDLQRSNRDLEQFAYVASHDLQEPLRKVSSFCQLLQRRYGGALDERADQYIEFAVDGAQRMQRLINDLLAFSRVGRTTEAFTPVELGEVAAAVRTQLDAVLAKVEGELVIDELPVVSGDGALLRQLLTNLIGNGLKFGRAGVPPVVRVSAQRAGDAWEVTVADNGIGIEPEYADKVFVIFQRLHGRDAYPGTGIGLALAKKIVEFHDGRIWLQTSDGPGATIRFTLPAVPSELS